MAWHPHLYRQETSEDAAVIITDPIEAQDELERSVEQAKKTLSRRLPFATAKAGTSRKPTRPSSVWDSAAIRRRFPDAPEAPGIP